MAPFIGEFFGSMLLILFGGGVVANAILDKTKGNGGGLIAITFGWAMAVFVGVFVSTKLGGSGHLNPAVTIALAAFSDFDLALVPIYLAAQMLGCFTGAVLVWIAYKKHFDFSQNADNILAVFSTGPAIRNLGANLATEFIATFVLVFGALSMSKSAQTMGTLDALPVALLVLGIGLSLGGPTGYAINPARDLAPRIAHFILPIPGKRNSDWSYSWVPVVAPILGALFAAWIFQKIS